MKPMRETSGITCSRAFAAPVEVTHHAGHSRAVLAQVFRSRAGNTVEHGLTGRYCVDRAHPRRDHSSGQVAVKERAHHVRQGGGRA
ncbi:MAG: hypothetical protein MZV70_05660 [Desulfobacterales bacterium]|nr:hypothetical protein [Desulfobacterales bacterium]